VQRVQIQKVRRTLQATQVQESGGDLGLSYRLLKQAHGATGAVQIPGLADAYVVVEAARSILMRPLWNTIIF
jgi:hypothetical protein